MEFIVNDFLKAVTPMEAISTISLKELLAKTGATGFKPMNATGKVSSRVHIMKGDQRLFAIALGKGVKLVNDVTSLEGLKELLDPAKHVIYYGKSRVEDGYSGNNWIAFGKKGELVEGKTYSIAELASVVGVA